MKKHLFIFSCLVVVLGSYAPTLSAQTDGSLRREVGISFYGLNFDGSNSFNAIYKKERADGKYRRIRGSFGNLNLQNPHRLFFLSINAGISVGTEKRRVVGKKTTLYTGPEFAVGTGFSKVEGVKPAWSISPRLGYILGIQHDFNEYFAMNLEIVPGGGFSLSKYSGQDVAFTTNGSFTSNAALTLMYKF